jgi:hypothetical protein
MKNKGYLWLEYLGVVLLWLVMFGGNVFSNLLFVDYMPTGKGFLLRNLVVNDFNGSINVLGLLREGFAFVGLSNLMFTFSILFAMLLSYFYIKRLIVDSKRFLFAFIFFFNPFVYTRIMIGQLGIVLAYFLLPMFLFYLFEMFEGSGRSGWFGWFGWFGGSGRLVGEFDYKGLLKVVLVMTLIGSITPHFFVFCLILFLVASFWFYFYDDREGLVKFKRFRFNKKDFAIYFKLLFVFVVLALLLNLYWIMGMFSGGILDEIDSRHEEFFSPKMSFGFSAISKVFGMWGFWREAAYSRAYSLMPSFLWYVLIFILVILMLVGYYSDSENKRSKFFFTLFWLGIILGVGISHPYTSKVVLFLFNYVPFFNGFRDSHKFVSFLSLSYAYFLPRAFVSLNRWFRDLFKFREIFKRFVSFFVLILFLIVVVSINFNMINFGGQLKNVNYPESYYNVNDFFNEREVVGYIVFLPFEGYLTYNWSLNVSSDGRVGSFVNGIIERGVVSGPDEYGGNSGVRLKISNCLKSEDKSCLREIGVEYIMHDVCSYYPDSYEWLSDFESVFSDGCVSVYYIGGVVDEGKIPLRFIIGVLISLISLVFVILRLCVLQNKKL